MFEVHSGPLPNESEQTAWILYRTGDGGFDLVAWFADKEDAEFAKDAFQNREDSSKRLPANNQESEELSLNDPS
jgi:hypothetical protein